MPQNSSIAVPPCYRHPSVERTARCALCGRAICGQCTLRTPSGTSCPGCSGSPERGRRNEASVPWRGPVASVARSSRLVRRRRVPVPTIARPSPSRRRRRSLGIFVGAAVVLLGCGLLIPAVRTPIVERAQSVAERALPHRIAAPVPVTTSGTYTFMRTAGDRPVTYDPCRTIRYALNLDEAPPGSEAVLGTAINEVERATGLRFEYVGTTHRKPLDKEPITSRFGFDDALPVTISWASPAEAPMLTGDIAGYAGSSYLMINGRPTHYVTGRVVLDAQTYASLVQTPAGAAEARAITMHELGHLVGLAHVDDPAELMNRENTGQQHFGPGDLAGLAHLGNGKC